MLTCRAMTKARNSRSENACLLAVERVFRRIGAGEMTHQPQHLPVGIALQTSEQCRQLVGCKAQAVHTRIYFNKQPQRRGSGMHRQPEQLPLFMDNQ